MNSLPSDLKASFSGYGYDDGYYYEPSYHSCCPSTVDSKTFVAFAGFIALATYLLLTVIDMSNLGRRRRKRSLTVEIIEGKQWKIAFFGHSSPALFTKGKGATSFTCFLKSKLKLLEIHHQNRQIAKNKKSPQIIHFYAKWLKNAKICKLVISKVINQFRFCTS